MLYVSVFMFMKIETKFIALFFLFLNCDENNTLQSEG